MLWTPTRCGEQPSADPSRCGRCSRSRDQPRRALTMQHENPTARYGLSFKARKPAGILLSRIPRKHSCQPARDGGARQGRWAPPYAASQGVHVPVPRQLYHAAPSPPDPQQLFLSPHPRAFGGKKGLQSCSRGFMAEVEARYSTATSKTPALPEPLSSPQGRTRSSAKPRSAVTPD